MNKMVIGTAAYCGSGQDTLADSICNMYTMKKYSMGDIVRELARKQGHPLDRGTLQAIRQECDKLYGRLYFPQMLAKKIKNDVNSNCMITGLRTMDEYRLFRQTFDFRFIFLNAAEEIRLDRMLRRKEEKDADTIETLRHQMEKECAMFDYKELEQVADITFDFSMDMDTYNAHESEVVAQIIKGLGECTNENKRIS